MNNLETIRLQVYLSRSGITSRREAAQVIEDGRVTVNGKVILEPGYRVHTNYIITVDGELVHQTKTHVYVLLNKPVGYVCSNSDEKGRPTAVSLVQSFYSQRLFTVGRLDINTKGLVFITSDGNFADLVMHPKRAIEKEYEVDCQKIIDTNVLDQWKSGINIKGEVYTLKKYKLLAPKKVRLVLTEGKNREIREFFSFAKNSIRKLERVRIGKFYLDGLEPGSFRKLSKDQAYALFEPNVKKPKKGHRV
jgi:23S rRNA pseudouridine2605 synthase